jgi:hypothetical protein
VSRPRFFVAVAASVALILATPFIRDLRDWIRLQFPGHFVLVVGSMVALAILAAIVVAIIRIRDRRGLRYGAIAAALILGASYAAWNAQGIADVDAVEQFHFVEYGLITLLFYRAWRPTGDASVLVLPLLAGLMVGTLDEGVQWFIPGRIGDMRDIFLNGAAIVSGLLFGIGLDPPFDGAQGNPLDQDRSPPGRASPLFHPGSLRLIGLTAAITIVVFTAFVHVVHLGQEIVDPEAGTFRSRYDAATLASIGRERLGEWKTDPPIRRPGRLAREDQYMSEALLHVQLRNRMWSANDFITAWHENLILEKYYAPVLDTPSYVSKAGHRWPDAQRVDAQQRLVAAGGSASQAYESRADAGEGHHFIRLWSPLALWGTALSIVAVVLALTLRKGSA